MDQIFSATANQLLSICFPGNKVGYAAGTHGTILKPWMEGKPGSTRFPEPTLTSIMFTSPTTLPDIQRVRTERF